MSFETEIDKNEIEYLLIRTIPAIREAGATLLANNGYGGVVLSEEECGLICDAIEERLRGVKREATKKF